jgi:DNA polymerase-3 subunit delta
VSTLAYVVRGNDPVLRTDALERLVDELLDGADRALALEEVVVASKRSSADRSERGGDRGDAADDGEGAAVAAVLNAAQSPPFMTSRRIVVVRDYEQIPAADLPPLVAYLADPLDTSVLVFVTGGGRVPKALADALKAAGAENVGGGSEKTADVLARVAGEAGLELRPDAAAVITAHLGEDAGRIGALVELLVAAFGTEAPLAAEDVESYLGEEGSVPVWQLTNRIEEGDVADALATLHRLLTATTAREPRPMHPLQVMGLLHSRYRRLLRLDDPAIRSTDDAHAALGAKGSTFPARKALEAARGLGTAGLRRAVDLLHEADLDLKGQTGLPAETIVELLVARLAALSARSRRGRPERPSRGSRRAS